jgi:hypothetical protein
MGSHIGCLTLNTSESHSAAVESSLLDVLEIGQVHPRFFLSEKACSGILKRAAVRGKELPPLLKEALQMAVTQSEP